LTCAERCPFSFWLRSTENLVEQSYVLQKYHVAAPVELPGTAGGDENGDELTTAIEGIVDTVVNKCERANSELSKSTDAMASCQRIVSENSAVLSHDQQTLLVKQSRMNQLKGEDGSIEKVRQVVEKVGQYEAGMGVVTPALDESSPQELYTYLGQQLEAAEQESTEGIQAETVHKIIGRMKKLVSLTRPPFLASSRIMGFSFTT
jgi:hypothetical protein